MSRSAVREPLFHLEIAKNITYSLMAHIFLLLNPLHTCVVLHKQIIIAGSRKSGCQSKCDDPFLWATLIAAQSGKNVARQASSAHQNRLNRWAARQNDLVSGACQSSSATPHLTSRICLVASLWQNKFPCQWVWLMLGHHVQGKDKTTKWTNEASGRAGIICQS